MRAKTYFCDRSSQLSHSVCSWFCDAVGISSNRPTAPNSKMTGGQCLRNDLERNISGLIEILGRNMLRNFEKKTGEVSAKTVGVPAAIRTKSVHNTNKKNYDYSEAAQTDLFHTRHQEERQYVVLCRRNCEHCSIFHPQPRDITYAYVYMAECLSY
jgi:hypothetical protein